MRCFVWVSISAAHCWALSYELCALSVWRCRGAEGSRTRRVVHAPSRAGKKPSTPFPMTQAPPAAAAVGGSSSSAHAWLAMAMRAAWSTRAGSASVRRVYVLVAAAVRVLAADSCTTRPRAAGMGPTLASRTCSP